MLLRDISAGDPQVEAVAKVIQEVSPDILVLADFDYDLTGAAARALAERVGGYPFVFSRRPNRGLPSGRDLDGNGRTGDPGDAEGYAEFAGQGGMVILSRFAFDTDGVRDFGGFRWADLADNTAPLDDLNPARLSTTVHWDVPVILESGRRLHLLTWHATAPVFDGPEDRNGRRNHDEVAFWLAYLDGRLPMPPPEDFVVLGVANADPFDGDSRPEALRRLLDRLQDVQPSSLGAGQASHDDGGANVAHKGPAALDTVDWPDGPQRPGNLRVDFVLPAPNLLVRDSGVFWPPKDDAFSEVVQTASRHRLVFVDLEMGFGTGE